MDGRTRAPGAETAEAELRGIALHLLGEMGGRREAVLRLRFGLDGEAPKTLREVGAHLGLTHHERVRQIEGEALACLREQMGCGAQPS